MTRTRLVLAALACAALVAHLLFIPYAYSPLSFNEALRRFAQIQWYQLGSDQNAALVSRALMFFPLGLLLASSVAPQPRRKFEWPAWVVACLLGCLWAVSVNFAQVWFPGRTVNLNNVAAEFCGVIAGGLLWTTLGASGLQWWRQLASGGHFSLSAALNGYVVLYLVASLTPFDFVTSAGELAEKTATDLYGLWVAPVGCGPAPCGLKFFSLLLATVPCGWWFTVRRRGVVHLWLPAALLAMVAAAIIEMLHFFMVSGVSQGASVLMRTLGMALGAATYAWRQRVAAIDLNRFGRPAVVALVLPYMVAIAYVGGWFRAQKLGIAAGLARMNEVVWLPFFHQYYAPYNATMSSALVYIALYAPIGVLCWLWARRRDRAPLWLATLLAGALAFAAETSKMFLAGRVPDYTDVFIAAVSATLTLAVLRFVSRSQHVPHDLGTVSTPEIAPPPRATTPRQTSATLTASVSARAVGAILLALAVWTAVDFPIGTWVILPGLVAYAALMFRFPAAYLIAIPLLLPVFDLAPISGRFFWDEFDALLATTLGVRILMLLPERRDAISLPTGALWLLVLSVVASTVIGLAPLDPLDANAFSNYLSSYNALRIAKGYMWAGVLIWLIWRDACARRDVVAWLAAGLALGLLAAAISVFWERFLFVGLRDFTTPFRAAGFVSATHVGGAYLEAVLVVLAPFALAQAVSAKRLALRAIWYFVMLLGAVAVLMTVSRAAFAAWLTGLVVFVLVWTLKSCRPAIAGAASRWRWGAGAAVVLLISIMAWGAQSTYLHGRLSLSNADLSLRISHWGDSVDMMRADLLHVLLGMGLGSFPREFYLAYGPAQQLPSYRIERDPGASRSYLVLSGGRGMYMDQRVAVKPGSELRIAGLVRSPQGGSTLAIGLCEKSFLNSTSCDWAEVRTTPTWQTFEVSLKPMATLRQGGSSSPVSLSFHNGTFGSRVELTRLSLFDGQNELLSNGSFASGTDRWFVYSDIHWAWRVLNTPIQIAFEQGALGVLAWLVPIFAAGAAVVRRYNASVQTAACTAAAAGVLVVAGFDSLLDAPRLTLLVAFLAAVCMISFGDKHAEPRARNI